MRLAADDIERVHPGTRTHTLEGQAVTANRTWNAIEASPFLEQPDRQENMLPVWSCRLRYVEGYCNILDDAWTLEFRVPLSAFGKEAEAPRRGFNICRNRRLRVGDGMKYSTWTPLAWGLQDAKNFGKLTFADGE